MDPERAIAVRTAMRRVEASVARFSRNDSADIVQEALVRAVRHGVECDAEPWLRTVARRIAIDRARAAREVVGLADIEIPATPGSAHDDPEAVVLTNETLGLVRKALLSMPVRYREALLAYVEEQETEGVARRFGISTNATWTLLSRARARLRKELDRVGYAGGFVAFRFNRWSDQATTAAATVGVAVTVAVSAAQAPMPTPPPQQ